MRASISTICVDWRDSACDDNIGLRLLVRGLVKFLSATLTLLDLFSPALSGNFTKLTIIALKQNMVHIHLCMKSRSIQRRFRRPRLSN